MKAVALATLAAALLAVAVAVVASLTGGTYAFSGLMIMINFKTVPTDVVSVVTFTNAMVRISLVAAAVCAGASACAHYKLATEPRKRGS